MPLPESERDRIRQMRDSSLDGTDITRIRGDEPSTFQPDPRQLELPLPRQPLVLHMYIPEKNPIRLTK